MRVFYGQQQLLPATKVAEYVTEHIVCDLAAGELDPVSPGPLRLSTARSLAKIGTEISVEVSAEPSATSSFSRYTWMPNHLLLYPHASAEMTGMETKHYANRQDNIEA